MHCGYQRRMRSDLDPAVISIIHMIHCMYVKKDKCDYMYLLLASLSQCITFIKQLLLNVTFL